MTLEHRSKIGKFLSYSLLTLIAIAFLFPFAWMLASSLKPTSEDRSPARASHGTTTPRRLSRFLWGASS